jgi:FdhE protein
MTMARHGAGDDTRRDRSPRRRGDTAFLHAPVRSTVFAERAMRLRQLARGHAMWDFLLFMADLAQAQQDRLKGLPGVALPDTDALDRAAQRGAPPLDAADWPRDPGLARRGPCHRLRPARRRARRCAGCAGEGGRREQRLVRAPGRLPAHRRDGGPGPGHRAVGGGGTAGLLDAHGHHADAAQRRPRQPFGRIDDETRLPLLRQPARWPASRAAAASRSASATCTARCAACSGTWCASSARTA